MPVDMPVDMPAAWRACSLSGASGDPAGMPLPTDVLAPETAAERGAHDGNIGLSQSFSNSAGRPITTHISDSVIWPVERDFADFANCGVYLVSRPPKSGKLARQGSGPASLRSEAIWEETGSVPGRKDEDPGGQRYANNPAFTT
jgi:hypothetical protein